MKVNGKITVLKQLALLAFALLYVVTAVFQVYEKQDFTGTYPGPGITTLSGPIQTAHHLVLFEAMAVNASDSGIVAEKETFILPVIFLLSFLLFFSPPSVIAYAAAFLSCRRQYLFRILPNAP